jgi:hypothetical protein
MTISPDLMDEAHSTDSGHEQHDEAHENEANVDVPGEVGHQEQWRGDEDVEQHLWKPPLSFGPKPCVFRGIGQFEKRRRRLRVAGPMGFGGGHVEPPDDRDAIASQHA